MVSLVIRFLGNRYHANAWKRHVNEGEVAWPPDPWRLTRALIATWHRKPVENSSPEALEALLASLADSPVRYRLPRATVGHTRHYMPFVEGANRGTTLVIDPFIHVEHDGALYVEWTNAELDDESHRLLRSLAERLTYLGRAESWVEVSVATKPMDGWNCELVVDGDAAEGRIVHALLPRSLSDYRAFRQAMLQEAEGVTARRKRELSASIPERWLDALGVETADLDRAGWAHPPAARKVQYRCLVGCEPGRHVSVPRERRTAVPMTTVRLALFGKPLPRVEDTVQIGEWVRKAVIKVAERELGKGSVPPVLSGHGLPPGNLHGHAFYLPEDADGDGYIEHVLIHAPAGLNEDSVRALSRLQHLRGRGRDLDVVHEQVGSVDAASKSRLVTNFKAAKWLSATPYLHPWFVKKGFGVEDQIRRECEIRDLPAITHLTRLRCVQVGTRERLPVHFRRVRSKRGLTQPDTGGSFWSLTFEEPIRGPLALGFGCHFGLGLFSPQG